MTISPSVLSTVFLCSLFVSGCNDLVGSSHENSIVERTSLAHTSSTIVPFVAAPNGAGLEEIVKYVIATHPEILAAKRSARAAELTASVAARSKYPSITAQVGATTSNTGSLLSEISVEQPLWSGGKINASIDEAEAQRNVADTRYNEAIFAMALLVVKNYFEVQHGRKRAEILQSNVDRISKIVGMIERRSKLGANSNLDFEVAQSRELQARQQLAEANSNTASALNRLRELVGIADFNVGEMPAAPASWPNFDTQALISKALETSPSVKRVKYEAATATAQARAARAERLPQLNARLTNNAHNGTQVGLVLSMQTGAGLSKFISAKAATERAEASQFMIKSAEFQVREEVSEALNNYDLATTRLASSLDINALSRSMEESYVRQLENGSRTWLDVLNVIRESATSESDFIHAQITAASSLAKLSILSGDWDITGVKK